MKRICLIIFLFLSFNLIPQPALANNLEIYLFYDPDCPVCFAAQKFLGQLKSEFPQLEIKFYQPFRDSFSQELYFSLREAYQLKDDLSVPVIFIENKAFINYNAVTQSQIKQIVIRCASQKCASPLEKIKPVEEPDVKGKNVYYYFVFPGLIILFLFLFKRKRIQK
jgi:hypothetical protein